MELRTELNYLRMAPRKVRLVADAIRGKSVPEAEATLRFIRRRAAEPLEKLLAAAVANARQNFQITSPAALVISRIAVNGGPTLKRSRPRAMGRAFPIKKRTSHVVLVLESHSPHAADGRPRGAEIAVAAGKPAETEAGSAKTVERREAFRLQPKVTTKPTGFVRRMFRRKAI